MVGVAACQLAQVEGDARILGKGDPEFLIQLGVIVAHLFRGNFQRVVTAAPAGDVHGGEDEGFIHGEDGIGIAANALLVAQGLGEGLTQTDADVMEIWTLVDDKPVMLAQGSSDDRYILQFVEEDNMWYVANERVITDATHGVFYSMLIEGNLEIMQGIVYDAAADPENPWFMAYDTDWDVSNDEPIDEDMANAILDNNRRHYTAVEYIPYVFYK